MPSSVSATGSSLFADFELRWVPHAPSYDVERIGVDDEGAARLLSDVEEVERSRRGIPEDRCGVLVIARAMAWTLELIACDGERNGAAEMGALTVRGDDSPRRMQQEETALTKEDRAIVRLRELGEDLGRGSDGDGGAETGDARHAQERRDGRGQLHDDQRHDSGKPNAQELASLKTCGVDGRGAYHAAILFGSREWKSNISLE